MKKVLLVIGAWALISAGLYLNSSSFQSARLPEVSSPVQYASSESSPSSDKDSMVALELTTQDIWEPAPPQEETNKHCERPNKDGTNPDVGGTDPSRIGCGCLRLCINGKPSENTEDGKKCKVHCKPDNCHCPNPCDK